MERLPHRAIGVLTRSCKSTLQTLRRSGARKVGTKRIANACGNRLPHTFGILVLCSLCLRDFVANLFSVCPMSLWFNRPMTDN